MNRIKIILPIFILSVLSSFAQKMTREMYINKYKDIAISEMKRSGIPASITLAQGILESNSGNSTLATKGNNHFGIKCHSSWKGKKIYHDDDEKGECFRKYKSAYDSYKDHTEFLMNGSRYDFLFELKPTDYKGWAKGLKKAGYATSPKYANALIKIIEQEQLYKYDKDAAKVTRSKDDKKKDKKRQSTEDEFSFSLSGRRIYTNNRIEYIYAKTGDTFYQLAQDLEMMPWELYKYNDLSKNTELKDGQILYIQPKRKKAEFGKENHVVAEGETLYDISKKYGVKISAIRKMNFIGQDEEPVAGDNLFLRKKNKEKKKELKQIKEKKKEVENESEFEIEIEDSIE